MIPKNYTIGYSPLTESVYLGKINSKGDSWLDKKDITGTFLRVATECFSGEKGKVCVTVIQGKDGKKFELSLKEITEEKK